jgi:hypothetical protein
MYVALTVILQNIYTLGAAHLGTGNILSRMSSGVIEILSS